MNSKKIILRTIVLSATLLSISVLSTVKAYAERKVIVSSTANIRSGPGTNYQVLWQVEKYFPILIIGRKGRWYKFRDFEKDEGWVHGSLLGNIPGVVAKKNCNIRSGPGTNFDIVFTAEKGVPFRELKRKGDWVEVIHADGDRGWIYRSLLW